MLLDEHLELNDYGTSIKKFYTGFVVFPKSMSNSIKKWGQSDYYEDTKIFELAAVLDYDYLMKISVKEALFYLKDCFLFSCQNILPTIDFPDFDTFRFLVDLEEVLQKEMLDERSHSDF